MRDLSKFEFLNLARPTRFQFITFRSFFLLSFGYGRMEENVSKRISSFINFLRKQIHLLPPPLSVFLPPNHAIRIETITIPSPPIPVPFPSRTLLSSLPPESGGISAQDMFSLRQQSVRLVTDQNYHRAILVARGLPPSFHLLFFFASFALFLEEKEGRHVFNLRFELFQINVFNRNGLDGSTMFVGIALFSISEKRSGRKGGSNDSLKVEN